MTPKQADKLIGKLIVVNWPDFNEQGVIRIVRRDRWNIYTDDNGVFDRASTNFIALYDETQPNNK